MGVLDKFLDIMKLSDDDDYDDDDFFDDDYEDDYEEKPKKSLFHKSKDYKDYDEEEDYEDDYALPAKSRSSRSNNKVTPMRQPARRNNVSMEVCVIKPTSVDDAREITETLLSGRTVISKDWSLKWPSVLLTLRQARHLPSAAICRRFLITYSW